MILQSWDISFKTDWIHSVAFFSVFVEIRIYARFKPDGIISKLRNYELKLENNNKHLKTKQHICVVHTQI